MKWHLLHLLFFLPQLMWSQDSVSILKATSEQFSTIDALIKKRDCKKAYEKLVALTEELATKGIQPDTSFAKKFNAIGSCLKESWQYFDAYDAYQKALTIYEATIGKEKVATAETYRKRCFCNIELRKLKAAEQDCQTAIKILEHIHQTNNRTFARVIGTLGTVYENWGHFEKAINYYTESLNLLKKIDPSHQDLGVMYYHLGNVFLAHNYPDTALFYFDLTYQIDSIQGNAFAMADDLDNFGLAYQQKKAYETALNYYDKGIKSLTLLNRPEEEDFTLHTLGLKGMCLNEMNKPAEAIPLFNYKLTKYLDLYGRQHEEVAKTYLQLAESYFKQNDYTSALSQLKNAANAFDYSAQKELRYDDLSNPYYLLNLFYKRANIYFARFQTLNNSEDLLAAESSLQEAWELIQYLRYNFKEDDTKLEVSRYIKSLYNLAITIGLEHFRYTKNRSHLTKVFALMEQAKSQLLLESFRKSEAEQFTNVPDSLLQQEQQLEEQIAYYEKERFEEDKIGKEKSLDKIASYNHELFLLKEQRSNLRNRLEKEFEPYFNLKYNNQTVSIATVQQQLLTNDQALIAYFIGDSTLVTAAILKDTFYIVDAPLLDSFNYHIITFKESITGYHLAKSSQQTTTFYNKNSQQYAATAHKLYQTLMAPLAQLSLPKNLIILPDGILGYLPFGALLTAPSDTTMAIKEYPFLINQYQISYCYSATLLQEMQEQSVPSNLENLLAVAPIFEKQQSINQQKNAKITLSPLNYNIPEVKDIHDLLGGKMLIGHQATIPAFWEVADNYKILHLSTHGLANDQGGDYSFLAFTEIADSIDNEFVYVRDLYNKQLPAEMVVLSACETGIGQLQKGEGMISLAKGFSFAGVKSLITTLWSINESSTKELLIPFYKNIKTGMPKQLALHQAQLELVRSQAYAHPYYWAAFIPIGDMRPIELNNCYCSLLIGASLGVILLLLVWLKRT